MRQLLCHAMRILSDFSARALLLENVYLGCDRARRSSYMHAFLVCLGWSTAQSGYSSIRLAWPTPPITITKSNNSTIGFVRILSFRFALPLGSIRIGRTKQYRLRIIVVIQLEIVQYRLQITPIITTPKRNIIPINAYIDTMTSLSTAKWSPDVIIFSFEEYYLPS